ncbi:MAG: hypothetical protein AAGJ70_00365 [Pseudomonadota bacterium]
MQQTFTRRVVRSGYLNAMLCVAAGLALAGCSMPNFTSGLGGGIFGGSEPAPTQAQPVNEAQLLAAAQSDGTSASAPVDTGSRGCPAFVVWPRDRNLTVYTPGEEGDSLSVIQRGEITKTARECQASPGRVVVRYGFSGRVLLGPRGKPGTFTLPISVFVTDFKRQKVQTQQHQIQVTVPTTRPIGYFSKVESVVIEVPQGVRPDDFQLFVAFEKPRGGVSG